MRPRRCPLSPATIAGRTTGSQRSSQNPTAACGVFRSRSIVIMRFIETGCSVQPRQVRGPSDEMRRRKTVMSVYKMIHVVGTSPTSWEEAAKNAVEEASKHLHDLRVSEVEQLDMRLEDGTVVEYRARVHVSFRYKGE